MKKVIAIVLVLTCLLAGASVSAESNADVAETIISCINASYGEPVENSYSVLGKLVGTATPPNTLSYFVMGSENLFMLEYYDFDEASHVWIGANTPSAAMDEAFAFAESLIDEYTAFYLMLVNSSIGIRETLSLVPNIGTHFCTDYDVFQNEAMKVFETIFPTEAK